MPWSLSNPESGRSGFCDHSVNTLRSASPLAEPRAQGQHREQQVVVDVSHLSSLQLPELPFFTIVVVKKAKIGHNRVDGEYVWPYNDNVNGPSDVIPGQFVFCERG